MNNISLSIVHTRTGVKLLRLFHDQGLPEPNLQEIWDVGSRSFFIINKLNNSCL